jgi:type II secretory pathway component PulK
MEFLIIALMAVFGAALIVGGFVAYRRSEVTSVRALSAGAIAAGVVMWAIIVLVTQVSTSSG